jgi:ketosteroid isomerase-like protein
MDPAGLGPARLGPIALGDLAFVHSLNRVTVTLANGRTTDMWVRWTACFRRIDGAWLIVHDHVSVPADLEHGKALTTLAP